MELYYATTYSSWEDRQILIGVYATQEIAKRELQKSLKKYDNDFKDEYVDALMEEGELELFENKIYFGKKEVEGNPKKVCLVVSYYVDYGGLESIIMYSSRKEITQCCKEMAEVEEFCEDPDDPKMVNAKAKEMKKDLLEGYCYSNPINGDPVKVCLTDFITIKMK